MYFVRSNPLIRTLASLKLTVVCLFLLAVLVFFGTMDQVEHGLYFAQQRFFNSWFVPGWFIMPGAQLVIWILFINLIAALLFRFNYRWSKLGLIVSHTGLIVLMLSAFMTLHFSNEGFIELKEGEQSNIASDYMLWELSVWKDGQEWIIKEKDLSLGKTIELGDIKILTKSKYLNARYFDTPFAGRILKQLELEKDFEKNNRAVELIIDNRELILEGENQSTAILTINDEQYIFELRRKRYRLPFDVQLLDVQRELHKGTEIAKSYLSKVKVNEQGSKRKLTISMNKPFRSGAYTLYQSSYGIDANGNEFSILALVKNQGRLLPYISSLIISLGLFIHFGSAFFDYLRSKND